MSRYDIDLAEAKTSTCDCCGRLTVHLTRFVERDGGAFAVYAAHYTDHADAHELAMLVSLGEWGDEAEAAQRVAFYCRVRCLLPIRVEHYREWCVGLWVEVSGRDAERIGAAWSVPEADRGLQFCGRIANALSAPLELPIEVGTEVRVRVHDGSSLPRIDACEDSALARLLEHEWSRSRFERFAVARGFL